MTGPQTSGFLLRLYPADWRERYGEELESLILETSGGRVPWSVRIDVVAAALRERARALFGRSAGEPRATLSASLPAMLWAWFLVVIGGGIVGKASEHWSAATPATGRSVPSFGFEVLAGGAIVGSIVVVAGALIASLPAISLLRGGSGRQLLRPFAITLGSSVALVGATVGLASWAQGLTAAQRNGHDDLYSAAFVGWAMLAVFTLGAWTALGAAIVRRACLGVTLLRLESVLSAAAALAMAAVTTGAFVWWAGVARSAPWFLSGGTPSAHGSGVTVPLVLAGGLMVAGTVLAAASAARSLRASSALRAGTSR